MRKPFLMLSFLLLASVVSGHQIANAPDWR